MLLAHGSARGGDDAIATLAERLRRRRLFAEVAAGFVKGEPGVRDAVASLPTDCIYLVPCFMAEGHYTRRVIPDALGLTGAITDTESRRLLYCSPVGASPLLVEVIRRRAVATCHAVGRDPEAATALLLAHGSPVANSFDALERTARRLRGIGGFAGVRTAFLEQPPSIAEALADIGRHPVVAVGVLAGDGVHATADIPGLLAATGAEVHYAGAIGAGPGIAALVLDRVRDFDRAVLGLTRRATRRRGTGRAGGRATSPGPA